MTTTKTWEAIYQIGLGWQDVMVSDTTTQQLHDALCEVQA